MGRQSETTFVYNINAQNIDEHEKKTKRISNSDRYNRLTLVEVDNLMYSVDTVLIAAQKN